MIATTSTMRQSAIAARPMFAQIPAIGRSSARTLATLSPDQNTLAYRPVKGSQPEPPKLPGLLRLQTGETFNATSFGAPITGAPMSGEIVFTTALVGYPESMTDPSYRGQILVFTQPLVGNYGVPASTRDEFGLLKHFESEGIQVQGIIVNDYATKYSHWNAIESLGQWCARSGVPALTGVDTRAVVTMLRERGSTLAEIRVGEELINGKHHALEDPNVRNLVGEASTKKKAIYNKGGDIKIALVDCGAKQNIIRCLAKRGAEVHVVPWDHDLVADSTKYDGVFLSNGPGNPARASKSVTNLRNFMAQPAKVPTPIFGICMGNQLLGLAAGYKTYKLKYGNRGHNQPALNLVSNKCVITSQNHGYALHDSDSVPAGWMTYFRNANDGSNEGIRHRELPYSSVQFHPEAMGGPLDTDYLFCDFVREVREYQAKRNNLTRSAISQSTSAFGQSQATLRDSMRLAQAVGA
ncbi:small subunit of carbamoyl-phosphate synthase [Phlyctochytrium arcticum]|nr:small subunit of carbamoyl-phosphate synthase [Phlyctochytrium arcticum]